MNLTPQISYGREPAAAIEADYSRAVASPLEVASKDHSSVRVKYLKPNDTGLFAVVEYIVPVAGRAAVLLELIVTGLNEEKHITLEGISGVEF
jgi:hypothetical protein